MRRPVRCRRPGCGGQLYLDGDCGGHLLSLVCILCNRTDSEISALALVREHGVHWRSIDRAVWGGMFVWESDAAAAAQSHGEAAA